MVPLTLLVAFFLDVKDNKKKLKVKTSARVYVASNEVNICAEF